MHLSRPVRTIMWERHVTPGTVIGKEDHSGSSSSQYGWKERCCRRERCSCIVALSSTEQQSFVSLFKLMPILTKTVRLRCVMSKVASMVSRNKVYDWMTSMTRQLQYVYKNSMYNFWLWSLVSCGVDLVAQMLDLWKVQSHNIAREKSISEKCRARYLDRTAVLTSSNTSLLHTWTLSKKTLLFCVCVNTIYMYMHTSTPVSWDRDS